jgi:PAS domain S-box-containing protein
MEQVVGQKKFLSKWERPDFWMIGVTLVVVGLLAGSSFMGVRMATRHAPLVDAAMEIKLELALAHLWFEELVNGDSNNDETMVWAHIDEAQWYVTAMLEGGENKEGTYIPLSHPHLLRELEEVRLKIVDFRAIARERLATLAQSGIGSDIDQRFDAVFTTVLYQTDSVETVLQEAIKEDLRGFKAIQAVLVLFCLGLGAWTAVLFHNYERKGRAYTQAQQKSEERWKFALEGAEDGVWDVEIPTRQVQFSKRWKEMLGYTENEITNRYEQWQELLHPDDLAEALEGFQAYLDGQTPAYLNEFRMRCKDGSYKWILARGMVVSRDATGQPLRMVGTHADITERKQAEEALRQSEVTTRNKLKAIVEPEGDIGTLELADIIDTTVLQSIMEEFFQLTGMLGALLDLSGNVLVAVGWSDICTKFHRVDPESCKNCLESDTCLTQGVAPGSVKAYHCKNHMWDMVTPLIVGGQHVGNVFIGQFFYKDETPDVELFREQARKYGFDEAEYLAALEKVPRFSREEVNAGMRFYSKLSEILSSLSFSAIQQSRLLAERKHVEEALRESEVQLRTITDNLPIFISQIDKDLNYLFANKFYYDLGVSQDLIIGKNVADVIGKETFNRAFPHMQKALSGELVSFENRSTHAKNNELVILQTNYIPHVVNGLVESFFVLGMDITERKRAEEALRVSEEKLRLIIDTSPIGICTVDSLGNFVMTNLAYEQILGYSKEELCGLSFFDVTHPEDRPENKELFQSMFSLKSTGFSMEKRYVRKDGATINVAVNATGVMDVTGHAIFGTAFIIDISARKMAEEEINRLNTELEQRVLDRTAELTAANKELEAFSYSVSHDLRAPLRAIDGFSNILSEDYADKLDADGQHVLDVIQGGARKMAELIDDLLAFSRLGQKDLNEGTVNMERLVSEIFEEFRSNDPELAARLEIKALPAGHGDQMMLRIVLVNLLSNAVKFSSTQKQAVIEVGGSTEGNENTYYVKDNGVGFDMAYEDKLFQVFQRLHSAAAFEGNGIGLALVQRIIHRHSGRVWAEAKVNAGATFSFTLPISGEIT